MEELEHYLHAYYDLIDQCKDFPDWERKIEEDLGSSMAMTATCVDESVRDEFVQRSPYF